MGYVPAALDCTHTEVNFLSRLRIPLLVFLPLSVTVVGNLALLCKFEHATGRTVRGVAAICWVFVLSNAPILIDTVMHMAEWNPGGVRDVMDVLSRFTISFNLVANPVIYCYSNDKFRFFLLTLAQCQLGRFRVMWNMRSGGGGRRNAIIENRIVINTGITESGEL